MSVTYDFSSVGLVVLVAMWAAVIVGIVIRRNKKKALLLFMNKD